MPLFTVEYSTNNSGGYDWLTKDDWAKLRKAGWLTRGFPGDVDRLVYATKAFEAKDETWALRMGIDEWETTLCRSADEEGCDTCGGPHDFYILASERIYDSL